MTRDWPGLSRNAALGQSLSLLLLLSVAPAGATTIAIGDMVYTDGNNIVQVHPDTGERTVLLSPGDVNTVGADFDGTIVFNQGGLLKRLNPRTGAVTMIPGGEDFPDISLHLARELEVPVALFDRPWNRSLPAAGNPIVRCADWREIGKRFPRP